MTTAQRVIDWLMEPDHDGGNNATYLCVFLGGVFVIAIMAYFLWPV